MSLLDTASLIVTPNGYKEGKLYSVIPSDGSGDLSVTRATTATRVNSAGLVELVPYNLFSYSQQFDNADWQKRNNIAVTSNVTTAPDGTMTADRMYLSNNLIADYGLFQNRPSGQRAFSVYAKQGEIPYMFLGFNNNTSADGVFFNLANGTISSNVSGYTASIEDAGNGWYRCTAVLNIIDYCFISPSTDGTTFIVVNQLNKGLYLWGAQLNEGTIKPYQKTETRLNIPRLDYSNGTCPSLLVEPQRTNIAKYSSSFDTLPWITTGISTITPNTTIAPDGTQTADTLLTDAHGQLLFQGFSASIGTTYTVSLYVKLGTATNLCLVVNNQSAWNTIGGQSFDSSDGLNTDTWTRISYTFTSPSLGVNFHIGANDQTGLTQSIGTVFIWGAQVEVGSYATSYIPTTSASVTRNADLLTKTSATALIGQTEGTIFVDFYNYANNSTIQGTPLAISNSGFYGDAIYFEQYLGNWYAAVWNGTSQQFIANAGTLSEGVHRFALAYKANDIAFYVDGNQIATDNSATIPTCTRIDLGAIGTSTTPEQMGINAAALWPTRLTNTQLAQLTSI